MRGQVCSRAIVMTKQFIFSLGERLVLPNTSHELECFQRHNDKTLWRGELAADRAANQIDRVIILILERGLSILENHFERNRIVKPLFRNV